MGPRERGSPRLHSREGGTGARVALFLVLALAGALAVAALAGGGDDSPPTDFRALGPGVADPAAVRVEVLNGAGVGGLARNATRRLRDAGFDVVFFGNASRFDHPRSMVLDRAGQPGATRAVAATLGIDSTAAAPDSTLMLEVTVILGEDWPEAAVDSGPDRDPGG